MKMITEPKLEDRPEQPTMGIRTQVPMKAFKKVIPQLLAEVFAWTEQQGIAPVGPRSCAFTSSPMGVIVKRCSLARLR